MNNLNEPIYIIGDVHGCYKDIDSNTKLCSLEFPSMKIFTQRY